MICSQCGRSEVSGRPKTLAEIREEVEAFVNKRDRVVSKGSKSSVVYQAVHMKSDRGDHPLCHIRPIHPAMVTDKADVDCRYCLIVLSEVGS